jgi:hypothetical protein
VLDKEHAVLQEHPLRKKRPTTKAQETYYRGKRDPQYLAYLAHAVLQLEEPLPPNWVDHTWRARPSSGCLVLEH